MMILFCRSTVLALAALVYLPSLTLTGQAQEKTPPEIADQVRECSPMALVLDDPRTIMGDISRLLHDLELGVFANALEDFPADDGDLWYSSDAGAILYSGNIDTAVIEVHVTDREKLARSPEFSGGIAISDEEWISLRESIGLPVPFPDYIAPDASSVLVSGDRLLACRSDKKELAEMILEAPLVGPRLDPVCRDIINRSGIALVGFTDDNWERSFEREADIDEFTGLMTDAEKEWLNEVAAVARAADFGVLGLKYHSKTLELRARGMLTAEKSTDGLLDNSKTDRAWQPDLGLEPDQLALAASFQLDAFHSSAGPRVVPHVALQLTGQDPNLKFLNGNMLRLLTELGADSWNELDAARIAVYQNEASENNGQLAIIGVVDAREPESVLAELRRLSDITSPLMVAERADIRADEIERLATELASDDNNEASRAETRLRLAGPDAIPVLKKAAASTDQRLASRADRVLGQLNRRLQDDSDRSAVADPWFWTTLNPGLTFVESTHTTDEFVVHTVEITPDASKTEEEVKAAVQVMEAVFGPHWNSVRVVQVRSHFVFMLGSDNPLLERVTKNVKNGSSLLMDPLEETGFGKKQGQLQAFFNAARVASLVDQRFASDRKTPEEICWAGLDFDKQGISLDLLIPVTQIVPFVHGAF